MADAERGRKRERRETRKLSPGACGDVNVV
jgi:hypothetical protein